METEGPTGPGPDLLAQMAHAQTDLDQNPKIAPHVSLVVNRVVARDANSDLHPSLKN